MDRDKYIFQDISKKYKYLKEHNYNVIALFLQGSQNYNLDIYDETYMSDIDVKAIVAPSLADIVSGKSPISTTIVLENNEHIEVKDIRVMQEMFKKQNISYLELLYTKYRIINPEYKNIIEYLLSIKDEISSINKIQFIKGIKGMSMEKLKALEHPYPNTMEKIEKFGYDPKQLHHIMRLYEFANRRFNNNETLEECFISKEKDYLIEIKKGILPLEEARIQAVDFDTKTRELCDSIIAKEEDTINEEAISKLEKITYDIIEFSLKKELITTTYDFVSVKQSRALYKDIKNKAVKTSTKQVLEDVKDEQTVDYSIYESIIINNIYD